MPTNMTELKLSRSKLKAKQPRVCKEWEKTCEVIVVEKRNGLFYAIATAPTGGCGLDRETLNVATPQQSLAHITEWANAHETRILSVQDGKEQ